MGNVWMWFGAHWYIWAITWTGGTFGYCLFIRPRQHTNYDNRNRR